KYIQDPINLFSVAATANDVSYVNIGDAGSVFGAELELKKDLARWNGDANVLSGGINLAYMDTRQEINADKVWNETELAVRHTHDEASCARAADLFINADLTPSARWKQGSQITATVAYPYFTDKVCARGVEQNGGLVDRAVSTLDLIVRSK